MLKKLLIVSTLALTVIAPAHARERDAGIAPLIAAQGNQALRLIRAEFKEAIRSWAPALPAKATTRVTRLAGAHGSAAAVRCAP